MLGKILYKSVIQYNTPTNLQLFLYGIGQFMIDQKIYKNIVQLNVTAYSALWHTNILTQREKLHTCCGKIGLLYLK